MKQKLTIYDIAREAGVSTATVTRVMSGSDKVKEATRQRVQAVIDTHGYVPSAIARNLETGKTKLLAFILPRLDSPYFVRMLQSADDEARALGYATIVFQAEKPLGINDEIVESILQRRLDGVIIAGSIWKKNDESFTNAVSKLSRHLPVVAICPPSTQLDCICLYNDLIGCAQIAARHLFTLGHRRIAFIGGTMQPGLPSAREIGCMEELRRLGAPEHPEYHVDCGRDSEDGARGTLRLLSSLDRSQWPTGIIAFSDHVALGVMYQLKKMGLRIPEDIAIVGCDNQYFCPYLNPPLTSVELHPEDIARSAVRELLAGHTVGAPYTVVLDSVLVVRESCGARLGYRSF